LTRSRNACERPHVASNLPDYDFLLRATSYSEEDAAIATFITSKGFSPASICAVSGVVEIPVSRLAFVLQDF
jgi:hypothetical protein